MSVNREWCLMTKTHNKWNICWQLISTLESQTINSHQENSVAVDVGCLKVEVINLCQACVIFSYLFDIFHLIFLSIHLFIYLTEPWGRQEVE